MTIVLEARMRADARRITGLFALAFAVAAAPALPPAAAAAGFDEGRVAAFVEEVAARTGWDAAELAATLARAKRSESVLKAISRPAEAKPWYQYRPIFVTDERAAAGVRFWQENADALARAEREYGVPARYIVAIIGVETYYGRIAGSFRVLDALATLGFAYPPRAKFFTAELEQFLRLCREQGLNPTALVGSYAGAMGLPQFMPSSYRAYAVDFDGDGVINIWDDPIDAIGSVASYLARHGWQRGGAVAHRVAGAADGLAALVDRDLAPGVPVAEAAALAASIEGDAPAGAMVDVIALEQADGTEYWLGYRNFYAITRYNHSRLYAMAVYELATAIAEGMAASGQG
mgnify:CR=1 FL=1